LRSPTNHIFAIMGVIALIYEFKVFFCFQPITCNWIVNRALTVVALYKWNVSTIKSVYLNVCVSMFCKIIWLASFIRCFFVLRVDQNILVSHQSNYITTVLINVRFLFYFKLAKLSGSHCINFYKVANCSLWLALYDGFSSILKWYAGCCFF
jgi:hypothetical protein